MERKVPERALRESKDPDLCSAETLAQTRVAKRRQLAPHPH